MCNIVLKDSEKKHKNILLLFLFLTFTSLYPIYCYHEMNYFFIIAGTLLGALGFSILILTSIILPNFIEKEKNIIIVELMNSVKILSVEYFFFLIILLIVFFQILYDLGVYLAFFTLLITTVVYSIAFILYAEIHFKSFFLIPLFFLIFCILILSFSSFTLQDKNMKFIHYKNGKILKIQDKKWFYPFWNIDYIE
jgi:hypothetical protein